MLEMVVSLLDTWTSLDHLFMTFLVYLGHCPIHSLIMSTPVPHMIGSKTLIILSGPSIALFGTHCYFCYTHIFVSCSSIYNGLLTAFTRFHYNSLSYGRASNALQATQ